MSDILCRVCSEPYDAYGVQPSGKGDMAGWEATLFLAGAGCPCCEGVPPEGTDTDGNDLAGMESLLTSGYDDFGHHAALEAPPLTRPAWIKPEGKTRWACDGCGATCQEDPDFPGDEEWLTVTIPRDSHVRSMDVAYQARHERLAEDTEATTQEELQTIGDRRLCDACWSYCDDCGEAPILTIDDTGDCYAPGASFPDPHDCFRSICIGCFEQRCGNCGTRYEDVDTDDEYSGCEQCRPADMA